MDESGDGARTRVGELLGRAGWLTVLDDIQSGLYHGLNGRLSSLEGLLEIIGMDGPKDTPVTSFLEGETRRLSDTVRAVRMLSGNVEGPAEPLMVQDLVSEVEKMHSYQRAALRIVTETTVASGLPPFRGNRPRLLRAFLVLLSIATEAAEAGEPGVRFGVDAEGEALVFRIEWAGDARTDPRSARKLEALNEVLEIEGGAVEDLGSSFEVRLPALLRAGG